MTKHKFWISFGCQGNTMGKFWSLDSRYRCGSFFYRSRSFPWCAGTFIIEFLYLYIRFLGSSRGWCRFPCITPTALLKPENVAALSHCFFHGLVIDVLDANDHP